MGITQLPPDRGLKGYLFWISFIIEMIWLIYFHLWPQTIVFTTANSLCTIYNSIVLLVFYLTFYVPVLIPKSNCNLLVGSVYVKLYFGRMFIPSDQKIWHWCAQNFLFKIHFGGSNRRNKTWKFFFLAVWIQLRKTSKNFMNSICFFENWLFLWMRKVKKKKPDCFHSWM